MATKKTQGSNKIVIRPAASIQSEAVSWLWKGYLPLGKISLLAGNPGDGKTTLALDIAARVSVGDKRSWPDGTTGCEPGRVLIISAEDDASDTIRPRLAAAKCNPHLIDIVMEPIFLDRDIARLEDALDEMPGLRLIVVDPLSAMLGGVDGHKNAAVRSILSPLADLAARRRIAVLAVEHLNKNSAAAASYRVGGSIGITAACRSVLVVARDRDDEELRFVRPLKTNLARAPRSLGYRIVDSNDVALIEWDTSAEPCDSLDEALGGQAMAPKRLTKQQQAIDFLREFLASGPRLQVEVEEAAREAGLSWGTIRLAKDRLGVGSVKHGRLGWQWELPASEDAKTVSPINALASLASLTPSRNGTTN